MGVNNVTASTSFRAIGAQHRITATAPSTLMDALAIAKRHLERLDLAASRFRMDSEVVKLAKLPATEPQGMVEALISPLLAAYLDEALNAGRWTDGLVDPTVGGALVAAGYDQDINDVRSRRGFTLQVAAPASTDWTRIELADEILWMPVGTLIDLGATAKAHAAEVIAASLAARLPGGFLVSLGGDCAAAGNPPRGGWAVAVTRHDGSVAQFVSTTGGAITTSSTRHRRWETSNGCAHHIVDPRTGASAPAVWASVTCAADSATRCNAASTAAIILGDDAPRWLRARGIPARLERIGGSVVTTSGWPTGSAPAALLPSLPHHHQALNAGKMAKRRGVVGAE